MTRRFATLLALALAFALAPAAFAATTYEIDPAHSDFSFKVRHFVTRVPGHFNEFSGTIVRDDENPSNSSVQITIRTASIDTGIERRDNPLRSADFFDAEKHPEITFQSTAVERVSDDEYSVTGRLTMRGITKVITLPVDFAGEMKDVSGNTRAGFFTETTLDRKEFGISWNKTLDEGGVMLGDDVRIEINIEAVAK